MVNDYKILNKLLSLISDSGFSNELILLGSWNEYFYQQIYPEFTSNMSTQDLDLYCINRKAHFGKNNKSMYKILIENGFACSNDYLNNKTTFFTEDFEIEFLHKNTREMKPTTKIAGLEVVAECLNGFESIERFYTTYHDDTYNFDVNILNPSYYCVHKISINADRKEEKKEKDLISIYNILELINKHDDLKLDFINSYASLSKKQKDKYSNNIKQLNIEEKINNILTINQEPKTILDYANNILKEIETDNSLASYQPKQDEGRER